MGTISFSSLLFELIESWAIKVSPFVRTADPFFPEIGRLTTVENLTELTRLTSGSCTRCRPIKNYAGPCSPLTGIYYLKRSREYNTLLSKPFTFSRRTLPPSRHLHANPLFYNSRPALTMESKLALP